MLLLAAICKPFVTRITLGRIRHLNYCHPTARRVERSWFGFHLERAVISQEIMFSPSPIRVAATLLLLLACTVSASAACSTTAQPALDRGFHQMYNLDFSGAHATLHEYQTQHPDDPVGFVSDGAAYLFSEFDRLHILESDLFTDDQKFDNRSKQTPDPKLKEEFDQHLAKSDALADAALKRNPKDANAMFAQVLANGLRGDYVALIEKRNLAGLSYFKSGRLRAQQLLQVEPTCYDAYLAIGAENYILGANAAPVRWVLRIAGSETDKDLGLQKLRLTAEKGEYLAPFARLLLAVAALRDKDPATARNLLAGLSTEFPQNQLYAKELAKLNPPRLSPIPPGQSN